MRKKRIENVAIETRVKARARTIALARNLRRIKGHFLLVSRTVEFSVISSKKGSVLFISSSRCQEQSLFWLGLRRSISDDFIMFLKSLPFICFLLFSNLNTCSSCVDTLNVDVDVTGEGADCVYIFTRPKQMDGTCSPLADAAKDLYHELSNSYDDLLAYYPFNSDNLDHSTNDRHGTSNDNSMYSEDAVCGRSRFFDGTSRVEIEAFHGFDWGSAFSVSVWFKRTGQFGNYQGIINNGYYTSGSWEIRMGRENSGGKIGGGVITGNSPATWDYNESIASMNEWHHVVMSYDGEAGSLAFYLDGVSQTGNSDCCSGPILVRNTVVTIGQAGAGRSNEYFYGFIDEVKIFSKALSADEVANLFTKPCKYW